MGRLQRRGHRLGARLRLSGSFGLIGVLVLLNAGLWESTAEEGGSLFESSSGHPEEAPAIRRRPLSIEGGARVEGALGGNEGVVFTLQLTLPGRQEDPVVFTALEGDDVMAKATGMAEELGLQRNETAMLTEAAKSYGQAARVLPLGELSLPLPDGRIAKLVVFDGDRAPDLRERLTGAGLSESEAEETLLEAMSQLRDEGLAAWMTTKVMVAEQEHSLSVYKDEDVRTLVRSFASQHDLPDSEASALAEHVLNEAIKTRAVPMLSIPVRIPAGQQQQQQQRAPPKELKVYSGENIREKVSLFGSANGLPEEEAASLLEHALRAAARSSFVPFAKHQPEFPGRQGEKLPELRVWARDNVTEAVHEYAEAHVLEPEQEAEVLEAVVAAAKAKGVLPLLSVRVNLRPASSSSPSHGDSSDTTVSSFELFEGDDLEAAVEAFAVEFGLDDDEKAVLLARAAKEGQSKRILPVLTAGLSLSFPLGPNGAPVAVPVALFDGDDPAVRAAGAAFRAGLNQSQAAQLSVAVAEEAKRERLVPAAVLQVPGASGQDLPRPLKLHFGDDVAAEVARFSEEFGLGPEQRQELLKSASVAAMEAKMVPVLSVPIRVLQDGDGGTREHMLELFRGEDVDSKVAAFARELRLDESAAAQVRGHVTSVAVKEGLLPILTLPLSAPAARAARLTSRSVEVFKGDSPEGAVERLLQKEASRKGPEAPPVPEETRGALVEEVLAAGKERRVFPEMRLNATSVAASDGRVVAVELYRGDDVAEVAKRAAASAGLGDSGRESLEAEVRVAAIQARVVPAVRVSVDLPGAEEPEPLDLFAGDDIPAAVEAFAGKFSLDAEHREVLLAEAMRRAQAARLVPVLSLPLEVTEAGTAGNDRKIVARLDMFLGDNVTATVRAFMARHGVGGAREEELTKAVYGAAVDNRLLPEFEVPVRAKAADGQMAESLFALFRGDDLQEAAGAFAEELGLGPAQVPSLINFLEKNIGADKKASANNEQKHQQRQEL